MKYEAYRKGLISSISHDLRTPLTTINGYVEGILDGIEDTEEKKKNICLQCRRRIWIICWQTAFDTAKKSRAAAYTDCMGSGISF